jgi:hypothetical protein
MRLKKEVSMEHIKVNTAQQDGRSPIDEINAFVV